MKVGILGAGQLAQLLAHSAYQLGLETVVLTDQPHAPATRNSPYLIGNINEQATLDSFIQQCDIVTLENENIDVAILQSIAAQKPLHPNVHAVSCAQDRFDEKQFLQSLGITTAPFAVVNDMASLQTAIEQINTPSILKTRRFGYDGKGQYRLSQATQAQQAWQTIGEQPAILEGFVDFKAEVSCLGARSVSGEIKTYPLITNIHRDGILRQSWLPSSHSQHQQQADDMMVAILEQLDYVGLLALECFVTDHGLVANEIAPRVHNSGHLTTQACVTSQFENHLRAITNMPLGDTRCYGTTCMINLIGHMLPSHFTPDNNTHLYDYGKTPRAGRKLGHVTIHNRASDSIEAMVAEIQSLAD